MHDFSCREEKGGSGLEEAPASHFRMSAHPFATGWSGSVVHGTYKGHRVAVKLAPFGSGRAHVRLLTPGWIHFWENCKFISVDSCYFLVCTGSLYRDSGLLQAQEVLGKTCTYACILWNYCESQSCVHCDTAHLRSCTWNW